MWMRLGRFAEVLYFVQDTKDFIWQDAEEKLGGHSQGSPCSRRVAGCLLFPCSNKPSNTSPGKIQAAKALHAVFSPQLCR